MSDKRGYLFAATRAAMETAPWHTLDGWFCTACDRDCGTSADEMCDCCRALCTRYDTPAVD